MKTQPILNDQGKLIAFEIESWRAGLRMISRFIENDLGAKVTARRKWFTSYEVHLRFNYDGHDFVVWEPHGDSNSYWICSADNEKLDIDLIGKLQNSFDGYRPGIIGLFMGALGI